MTRNEKISNEEYDQFTTGCCDNSKIKTKSGYRNNRCQEYTEVKVESLTKKFDEFGDRLNEQNCRVERSNIAESRFQSGACKKESIDDN